MYLFYHIIYTLHLAVPGPLSSSPFLLYSSWGSWLTHFIKALFAKGVDWVPLPDAEAVCPATELGVGTNASTLLARTLSPSSSLFL